MGIKDILITGKTANYTGLHKDPPKKPSKYHSKKVELDGLKFDSQKEADHWVTLCLLQSQGAIDNLKRQVKYEWNLYAGERGGDLVQVGKTRSYVADFVYDLPSGKRFVEDVKPMSESEYREKQAAARKKGKSFKLDTMDTYLEKKKIVKALFGIDIVEVS